MACPSCGVATFGDGLCAGCKANPRPAPAAEPESGEPPPMPSPDDFVGRMIPTGNKPSLIAYYCAFGAMIPGVGILPGVVAVIYGVKGIKLVRRYPEVRGGIHAWFGLLVGGLFTLAWLGGVAVVVVASMATR